MMLPTEAALFLPLSDQILGRVLDQSTPLAEVIAELAVPQIAAVIVVQCLCPVEGKRAPRPERLLTDMIDLGNTYVKREGIGAFVASALHALDRTKIQTGRDLLVDARIVLLEDHELAHRTYLTAEGRWDNNFTARYREQLLRSLKRIELPSGEKRVLTPEQGRVFREFEAQPDEALHIQGYAGIGKTYLIRSVLNVLVSQGARVLVLAERQRQLQALLAGIDHLENVWPRTFERLMDEVIPDDLTAASYAHMRRTNYSRAQVPDETIIQHLGIRSSSQFSAVHIAKVVRGTVTSFCRSGDPAVTTAHIPQWYAPTLDPVMRRLVVQHATDLWNAILLPPSKDFRVPVRGYHRIKWAALNGWHIPARYTHVLIDECHDLAKSMLQILDASPQATISLGDEYQNLQGRPQYRSTVIRQRELTNSVRSGELIEDIINPIIAAHPGKTKLPFSGNSCTTTEVDYYAKPEIPRGPAVILVHDRWGLFEWAQRLAEKVDFELLTDPVSLNMFVSDCIELRQHGIRARHGELFRFGSWEAVAESLQDHPGFLRIDRMLARGYSIKDWTETMQRAVQTSRQGHALGLIEDVRNREFGAVMVAPEVGEWASIKNHTSRAEIASAIYVAVTRARHRLILPQRLQGWIGDLPAT